MGRRNKRLRAQLRQYALDEAGSYSMITQWNPPQDRQQRSKCRCCSKRCAVVSAVVVVVMLCVAAVTVAVVLGVDWDSLTKRSSPHHQGSGNDARPAQFRVLNSPDHRPALNIITPLPYQRHTTTPSPHHRPALNTTSTSSPQQHNTTAPPPHLRHSINGIPTPGDTNQ